MREFKTHTSIFMDRSKRSVSSYLKEISHYPLISPDEEADLVRIIKEGGPEASEARDKLIKANLRFVVTVANRYTSSGALELSDLISEGNIGLLKALEAYDETRGYKFISYAVWWIRQSIMAAVDANSSVAQLPSNQQKILNKYRHFQEDIYQREGRSATIDEFCEVSDLNYDTVSRILEMSIKPKYMDDKMSEESNTTFGEMMASDTVIDTCLNKESLRQDIADVLAQILTEREIFVLTHLYGIGCTPLTLDDIAIHIGLSRERTRQISISSVEKIRHSPQSSRLLPYLAA